MGRRLEADQLVQCLRESFEILKAKERCQSESSTSQMGMEASLLGLFRQESLKIQMKEEQFRSEQFRSARSGSWKTSHKWVA